MATEQETMAPAHQPETVPMPARAAEMHPEQLKMDRELIETRRHDFETFYKYMRMYQDEGWTLLKIESASPQLNETIKSFRDVLQAAGIYDVDGLLEGLLAEARHGLEGKLDKHDFIERIFDHTKMSGGPVQKFYEAFVAGLKGLQEAEQSKRAA